MAKEHDTGYDTVTERLGEREFEISYEGENELSFDGEKMLAAILGELQGKSVDAAGRVITNQVNLGFGVMLGDCSEIKDAKILTIAANQHPIFIRVEQVIAMAKVFGGKYVADNNDAGESGEADYLGVDPKAMAREIVARSRDRGAAIALALFRELGYDPSIEELLKHLGGAGDGDKLQPKVPVDPKSDEDPWSRFG